ncbi:hypothetical protein LSH36_1428g00020 [Paralvinella palmiformis]|uniref:Uncharacterized protein n=1 Tax=Paralvinella palmiformis TaxID=53620 RepID=A0AAD9ISM1_9ANNE|nr:hypothetical protein LSH36_1428g00020 [Paralvinella palmiformis]
MLCLGNFFYTVTRSRNCKLVKKFRHLTDESEHTNFAVLCHEVLVIAGLVPSTITGSATPLTCDPVPSSDGHVKLSLRKGFSSPHRDRIRKRLEFVSKGKFEMKRKYVAQMKDLNARHHKTVKYLNQETVEKLQCSSSGPLQKEGKTFLPETRMFVYDAIISHVMTRNVQILLGKFAQRCGLMMDIVPHRTTIEMMVRELGVVADLQAAEMVMTNTDLTLGFDATTQESVHINSVHITSKYGCNVIAVHQLAGGTAEDYMHHIDDSVKRLAEVYSSFYMNLDYEACRRCMIANIANTMTDCAAVNHATIVRVCEIWGKTLNELNCHLHPLDTIASAARSALKELESGKGKLFGRDCIAGNIVVQMNKFRFKDGKGDPRGCHNIDAEQIMGMFSAAKNNAPNATLNYPSSKIRAQRNAVVDYLDSLNQEKRNKVIQISRTTRRKQRQASRRRSLQIREDLSQRIALKREKTATAEKN